MSARRLSFSPAPVEDGQLLGDGSPISATGRKSRKRAPSHASTRTSSPQFKDGYDTIIGEKGSTVSGGQRQRLSIARAIYKNPPILILDDSLSAVDADTEKKILANIRDYRRGKTTFVIAHRISAVEEADDILVMDGGRIVGEGKHHFLLESCPLYRDIYRLQELERRCRHDLRRRAGEPSVFFQGLRPPQGVRTLLETLPEAFFSSPSSSTCSSMRPSRWNRSSFAT